MKPIHVTRVVRAPLETVFQTIADIRNFSQAVPEILAVEFLTEQRTGVGTRFRETRLMGKKEASTELEVTEYVENELIRMVSDEGGTIWDTIFTVKSVQHTPADATAVDAEPGDSHVELNMTMEIRPYKLAARLFMPLIRGMVTSAVERDMNNVAAFCEQGGAEGGS